MSCNIELAKARGVEHNIDKINMLHNLRERQMEIANKGLSLSEVAERSLILHDIEFQLQELWGFPRDGRYHISVDNFKFLCNWVGRVFTCTDTNETIILGREDVYECAFISVGKGFIDLGRLNAYHRIIGNVVEVV